LAKSRLTARQLDRRQISLPAARLRGTIRPQPTPTARQSLWIVTPSLPVFVVIVFVVMLLRNVRLIRQREPRSARRIHRGSHPILAFCGDSEVFVATRPLKRSDRR
jgi:hypothetical protein